MEPALTAAQAALLAIARQRIAELLPSRAERVGSGSVVIPSIVGEQTYGASTESSDS